MHFTTPLLCCASVLTVGLLMGGCASDSGNARAHPTITSVADSRQEIVDAKTDIAKTVSSLSLINHGADLTKSYDEFSANLKNTERSEQRVRDQRERLKAHEAEYINQWQQDSAKYTDDDLRKSSVDRQAAVKKRFADIEASYADLAKLYEPFHAKLADIQGALRNDLTQDAVRSVRPTIDSATEQADGIQAKADDLIKQLDELNASLSPTAPPKN